VHAVHVPFVHSVAPAHDPQFTLPLPHALAVEPHFAPAAPASSPPSGMHSGGVPHRPPMHCWPDGQEHDFVLPHWSVIVPHSVVFWLGLHVRMPQPESTGPASVGASVMHALFTQSCPVGHPPQLMATPHESVPMTPHLPVHPGGWQLWLLPVPVQTWPLGHALPQVTTSPLHSVMCPHWAVAGHASAHPPPPPPPSPSGAP
jgi:hypothetical protein